jgi:ATP-dependent exoDNAse (exonuclease V) beta subunit
MLEPSKELGDAQVRERAVSHAGSVLVQAPAGSGKTSLLTQRYLRLLAEVDAPERILALTFTRRAAEEMRERVGQALRAAGQGSRPANMHPRTWALGRAAGRRMQQAGIDLEAHPARLRIETIDAFNAWLAAQLPVGAGTGAPLRTLEDARETYAEAARRALAYDAADAFGAAVDRVLGAADLRWPRLVERIAGLLGSRDRWLPLLVGGLRAASDVDAAALERARAEFDADLRHLVERGLGAALAALGPERTAELARLATGAAQRLEAANPALAAWRAVGAHSGAHASHGATTTLGAAAADLARWRELADIVLTQGGTIRARVTKTQGFPVGCADKPAMLDLLTELAREDRVVALLAAVRALPDAAYSDAEWAGVRDVAQVLLLASVELDQVFREQGAVDFTAVAMAARRALGSDSQPTDLALRLDYRLQHVLIDEFQDTSAPQVALLRVLTAGWQPGDGRSIFCVGDPMQSIYRFRQAEVRAFLELAERGIGELRFDVQRLTSNFRTMPPVLDWINGAFAAILPQRDDRDRGAIAFRPSTAARPQVAGLTSGVTLAPFATRAAEAAAVAAGVAEALAEHPDWHVAILVRAKAHARDIAQALRSRGIAFAAVDIEPLGEQASVRDLLMLARALLHWGDRTAWLAVLRAPWVGLTLADLLAVARGASVVWDALADPAVLAQLSPDGRERALRGRAVLEAAQAVRTQTSFTRWLERTWLALGGPACVGPVQDLEHAHSAFRHIGELERRGLPDPADFADAFADLFARDAAVSAVEIMTIHKAKGLEFDLVIVPALDRAIPARSDDILLAMPFARADRDGFVMAARPPVGSERQGLFGFLRGEAKQAAELEAERLLYVACTRAKSRLVLSAVVGPTGDGGEAGEGSAAGGEGGAGDAGGWSPRAGSLLRVLWPIVHASFSTAAGAIAAPDEAARGVPLRRMPAGWSPSVSPPAFDLVEKPVDVDTRGETPVFDWAGETARQIGSLVHAELQTLQLGDADQPGAAVHEPRFRSWLALRGVPAERLAEAGARVVAALEAVQADPRARWILDSAHREQSRELALSGVVDGEIVRVVFDRSFVSADGIRWVIDYKTSQHMGGGTAQFLDREVERYRAQLQRYAVFARRLGPEPVRVGLYFPLMRAWREWEPR